MDWAHDPFQTKSRQLRIDLDRLYLHAYGKESVRRKFCRRVGAKWLPFRDELPSETAPRARRKHPLCGERSRPKNYVISSTYESKQKFGHVMIEEIQVRTLIACTALKKKRLNTYIPAKFRPEIA